MFVYKGSCTAPAEILRDGVKSPGNTYTPFGALANFAGLWCLHCCPQIKGGDSMDKRKGNYKNGKATQYRTGSEAAKRNGRKGGIKSGESRNLKSMLLKAMDSGGYEKMVEVAMREMEAGNSKFWELIRDTIGEKPTDSVSISENSSNPLSGLTTEELKKLVKDG